MADFKKYLDTHGKSLDEIKKAINDMVSKAVDNVVDDIVDDVTEFMPKDTRKKIKGYIKDARNDRNPEYSAQKIPPRRDNPVQEKPPQKRVFSYSKGRYIDEPPQLEQPNPIAYPHESLSENMDAQEEYMVNKIREMRSLEEITHNSYIVKQCAQITMVRQGEFMKDVEDDFERRVFCALPHPIYAAMSNSQLRTYFSWRTDVRRGVYGDVEQPYILLYCFELMNRIGVCSADDAFERLIAVWENCNVSVRYAEDFIPRWIKDFYAYNDVTVPLPESFTKAKVSADDSVVAELEAGNYEGKLDFFAKNSAYDISESVFITPETRPMMEGACAVAFRALEQYFAPRGVELPSLICGRLKKDFNWEPFKGAIVDLERTDGFREVEISPTERYSLKRGEPVLERYEFSASRGFVGYVLKSVEAQLRKMTGFSRKIIPNIKMLESDIKNREKLEAAVSAPEFAEVIPRAVEAYCRKTGVAVIAPKTSKKAPKPWDEEVSCEPVVVDIDVSKLDEIRKLADENAQKLIVDELEYQQSDKPDYSDSVDYESIAGDISDDEFDECVSEYAQLAPSEDENPAPEISAGNPDFEDLEPEWRDFANNLTPDNILFLRNLMNGTERDFCRERNIMPQTMIEEINEEALNALEDVVIEGGAVLEDYVEQVRALVEAFKA